MNYQAIDSKARPGAFSTLDMEVFVPEIQKLGPGDSYLEIGVDQGKSLSVARMVAHADAKVFGVDVRPDPEVPGTIFLQGRSGDIADFWEGGQIKVLFIDGDHTYEGCKTDITKWHRYMAPNGVILFHDADATSPGVLKAIREFTKKYSVKDVYYHPDQRCSMARVRL